MSETLKAISRKDITAIEPNINTAENIQLGSLMRIADALENKEQQNFDFSEIIKALHRMQEEYDKKLSNLNSKYSLLKKRVSDLESLQTLSK